MKTITRKTLVLIALVWIPAFQIACKPALKTKGYHPNFTEVESTVTTTSAGTVDAENQAALGFTAAGRVSAIHINIGSRVKKGKILAQLENTDLRIVFEDSEKELKRARTLLEKGLLSESGFDEIKRASEIAKSNYERTLVRAPFDGVITELNLELGELASSALGSASLSAAPKAALRIVDENPRVIKGEVDEMDLAKLRPHMPARIRIPAVQSKPFEGEVYRWANFVNSTKDKDRTSTVEFRLKPESVQNLQIPVGASADIEVIIDKKTNVLTLPTRTLVGRASATGSRSVFILEDGKAKLVPVQVGLGNYDRIEVLSGVDKNATVLVQPDDKELSEGAKVQVEILPWP